MPPQHDLKPAGTHALNEAMHGMGYGAGFGLVLGLYVLFCPLWVTVSPAWYIHTQWYVIMAITILSSMVALGGGAAVLGAHVLNRKMQ